MWEYLEVKVSFKQSFVNRGKISVDGQTEVDFPQVIQVNGKPAEARVQGEHASYSSLHEYLQILGQDGWELVTLVRAGAHYYGKTDYGYAYLKRSKK